MYKQMTKITKNNVKYELVVCMYKNSILQFFFFNNFMIVKRIETTIA